MHLRTLADRASILITQPVKDDYRDLPLGTDQVAAMLPAGQHGHALAGDAMVRPTTRFRRLSAIPATLAGSAGCALSRPPHAGVGPAQTRTCWRAEVTVSACRAVGEAS